MNLRHRLISPVHAPGQSKLQLRLMAPPVCWLDLQPMLLLGASSSDSRSLQRLQRRPFFSASKPWRTYCWILSSERIPPSSLSNKEGSPSSLCRGRGLVRILSLERIPSLPPSQLRRASHPPLVEDEVLGFSRSLSL